MTDDINKRSSGGLAVFAAAIFISSFLIFQVQPLIGKYILPWFGGTAGVWSTCMLFFQIVLFAGYAYAHLLIKHFSIRNQCLIHFAAMIGAIFLLPIAPSTNWKPIGTEDPTLRILGLLAASVGLPYFLLSANGPLLQAWFSRANPGRSPYGLYSLSNVGSLLGLVSYPFLVEPRYSVDVQARYWSWGFAVFAIVCLACAFVLIKSARVATPDLEEKSAITHSSRGDRWLWFTLSACASVMLLAATNQVCIDVAAIPFLWVLPLSLYLLTFIIAFAHPRWYPRWVWTIALVVVMVMLCTVMDEGAKARIDRQIAVYFGAMFVCCMVCHGELVRLKPEPARLTSFYMLISAGGAAGGIFVALIAPMLFPKFFELHIGAFACCALALVAYFRDRELPITEPVRSWVCATSIILVMILGGALWSFARGNVDDQLTAQRNFFGVLRVREFDEEGRRVRVLVHGQILHGQQVMSPEFKNKPVSYYTAASGAGLLMSQPSGPRKIGVVGLGTGTLAAHGRSGDSFRFYEINPTVIRLADEYFSFLKDSLAQPNIRFSLGDARLSLERESPQAFDCLLVDAFSSDAIPAHLLTEEAFEIYLKHLGENGVLAIHISNRHFDLKPVVRGAARRWGLWMSTVTSRKDDSIYQSASTWCLLARAPVRLTVLGLDKLEDPTQPIADSTSTPWTDNFSNLFGTLKPRRKDSE